MYSTLSPYQSEADNSAVEHLIQIRRLVFPLVPTAILVALAFSPSAWSQQSPPVAAIIVRVSDGSEKPLTGVRVQLSLNTRIVEAAMTDEQGVARFSNLFRGSYDLVASKDGFETLVVKDLAVAGGAPLEVKLTLPEKVVLRESVIVQADAADPAQQATAPPAELHRALVKALPNRPATVTDTLPLVPGVARSPEGEIKIAGSGEHRSALLVNSLDVTDPATGQFGLTVPVDSVETISVFKSPYLAQFGRFTAGVVAVETRRGGNKWNFELNDPLPEFRIRSGKLRGLSEASPRVTFNGPLLPSRLYLSQGLEYELEKRPVRTLPFPVNETKGESVNSFTQLDYALSQVHTLTATLHVASRHMTFVNLDFFNPRPVTPNFGARDYTGTLIDRLTIGSSLLETAISIKRSDGRQWGQGGGEMTLTPTGNRGNYFSQQTRSTSRLELLAAYSLAPIEHYGQHHLKLGTTLSRTTNGGEFVGRTVNFLNAVGELIRRIEFSGGRPFHRSDTETGLYGQDHWVITPNLAVDMGTRLERQGITGTFRVAPRLGLAWSVLGSQRLIVRGGLGLFYDRVPLNVYAFYRYPSQTITSYGPGGAIIDGPRHFFNITDRAEGLRFPFIYRRNHGGNFAPYSATWSVELEHRMFDRVRLRANYLRSHSAGVITITPKVVQGRDAHVLSGGGKSSYSQLELTSRVSIKEDQQFYFSYVRSRARGDLNEFNSYLGNFPFPVVRPNQVRNLPGDLPNRFLMWGVVQVPWRMGIAPIIEYRNGFPYSVFDGFQNYAGVPNAKRFPNFFSFDARVSKDFAVSPKYTLRFSVSGFNLTNHFNALAVHSNIADSRFGEFFGNYRRRFRLDFDVIF